MKNIIIFGAPGSGKGTYSDEIVEKYGMGHISTGDVLRAEIKNGTELGKTAKGYIDNGQLIPDELMIDILAKVYDEQPAGKGVIFDGFPRTIAQAEALKKMLAERKHEMGVMIELIVDEDTLMKRLLNRAIEQGRADDNEETIKKRFSVYHSQTEPLAAWFQKEGIRHTFTWEGSKDQMLANIFTGWRRWRSGRSRVPAWQPQLLDAVAPALRTSRLCHSWWKRRQKRKHRSRWRRPLHRCSVWYRSL